MASNYVVENSAYVELHTSCLCNCTCCGSLTSLFVTVPVESTSIAKLVKCFVMQVTVVEFEFSISTNTSWSDHPPVALLYVNYNW